MTNENSQPSAMEFYRNGEFVARVGLESQGTLCGEFMIWKHMDKPTQVAVTIGGHEETREGQRRVVSWLGETPSIGDEWRINFVAESMNLTPPARMEVENKEDERAREDSKYAHYLRLKDHFSGKRPL